MEKFYMVKVDHIVFEVGFKNYVDAFRMVARIAKRVEQKGDKGYQNLKHSGTKNRWIGTKTKKEYEIIWIKVS